MKQKVSPLITVVVLVVVVAILGYFGYRALVPKKVLLAPGTRLTPPAGPSATR